ncbi:MAG TPA: hypothetical protein VMY42_25595 [Thermoguttaceae bacterium]|nr:hypothetical protein [Thermoguttaceae bacterium]
MIRLNYVPGDGYTEPGFIQGIPGLHDVDLRFSYRPMLVEERARVLAAMEKMKPDMAEIRAAEEIALRLATWDMTDARGEPVGINAHIVRRIKPAMFNRLWGIVLGTEPSDIDPQWGEDTKTEVAGEQFEAAVGPEPVGDVRARTDEKN